MALNKKLHVIGGDRSLLSHWLDLWPFVAGSFSQNVGLL
jgi:hypothetical protein